MTVDRTTATTQNAMPGLFSSGSVGGGGTTNNIGFPSSTNSATPTGIYTDWIVDDLAVMIAAAMLSPSPYASETVPNHDSIYGTSAETIQASIVAFRAIVNNLDEENDFADHVSAAITQAALAYPSTSVATDMLAIHSAERSSISTAITAALTAAAAVVAGTPIAGMVTAYETKIKKQYHAAISRLSSGMADINAVNSSAFIWGLSGIERELLDGIAGYTAGLEYEAYKTAFNAYMDAFKTTFQYHLSYHGTKTTARDNFLSQSVSYIGNLVQAKIARQFDIMIKQSELNMLIHNSNLTEYNRNLELEVEDTLWDWKLYAFGGNMLAAAGGAVTIPKQMSEGAQALSGAFSGASIAALIPGVGAVGILGGAVIGMLTGSKG